MQSAIIDPETGELATEWCPRRVREWFHPRRIPSSPCQYHTYQAPMIADDGTVVPDVQSGDWLNNLGKRLKRILRF